MQTRCQSFRYLWSSSLAVSPQYSLAERAKMNHTRNVRVPREGGTRYQTSLSGVTSGQYLGLYWVKEAACWLRHM